MFRQSIDPRGGFPPKASRKSKPKKAKKGLKKRRSKKQSFERERKAEQAFRFGEVRSGLSGRSVYNPNDFIRFHQSAQFNQQRDEAERTRRGGTFTGTSIGEERKVQEAQEVDRRFKERQLQTQERFAGALENFVERIPKPRRQRVSTGDFDALLKPTETITLSDRPQQSGQRPQVEDRTGVTIEEIQTPPPIPENVKGKKPQPQPEPEIEPLLQEVSDDDPIPEQGYSSHRKPEDDLNVKGSSSRGLPRQTSTGSIGSLSRQTSGSSVIEAVTHSRPRPTPSNPSKTDTIPSDHFSERRSPEQVKPVVIPQGFEDKLQTTTTLQIKPEETKPSKTTEEDIPPDLEPTSSALSLGEDEDVLAFRKGESVSERRERIAREIPVQTTTFKVKTSDTAPTVEEDKPETELQKELREKEEEETKRQQELVRQANERREEKRRRMAEAGRRAGLIPPEPEPEPEPEPIVEAGGQVEEEVGENWLESLGQKTSFHSGKRTNQLTGQTYSFVVPDGVGYGKFRGKEVTIVDVNKGKNVLVQLSDTIGTGSVSDEVRGNRSYALFLKDIEQGKIDLKPVQPTE